MLMPPNLLQRLHALRPLLSRCGSLHAEKRPSGKTRVVLRYADHKPGTPRRVRSLTLLSSYDQAVIDQITDLLVAWQGRKLERAWPPAARAILQDVRAYAAGLTRYDRDAALMLFRATGGDFKKMVLASMLLRPLLADRARRRHGGRLPATRVSLTASGRLLQGLKVAEFGEFPPGWLRERINVPNRRDERSPVLGLDNSNRTDAVGFCFGSERENYCEACSPSGPFNTKSAISSRSVRSGSCALPVSPGSSITILSPMIVFTAANMLLTAASISLLVV